MSKKVNEILGNVNLWRKVAIVAGVYSFIMCVLIIANFIQINRVDPVNTTVLNTLVERLSQNPDDAQLREEIRQLDLLARKAYFTNQWQIRNGAYLLAIGVLVLIIALQIISSGKKNLPDFDIKSNDKYFIKQHKARLWVSTGGSVIVIVAMVFAVLTQNQLKKSFDSAKTIQNQDIVQNQKNEERVTKEQDAEVIAEDTKSEMATEAKDIATDNTKNDEVEVTPADQSAKQEKGVDKVVSEEEMKKNFPNFRGYGGLGIVSHKNFPTAWDGATGSNIHWKSPIPLNGYNSPVVWEDKVFVAGANATKRELYCFDAKTGKILWVANTDGIQGTPAQSPNVRSDTGHSAPTVATDGTRAFAIFANGDIIAVNMQGERIWGRNLGVPQNHYGHSSSLITFKNLVIVQLDDSKQPRLMGLSSKTGEQVWSTPRKVKVSWASPILVNTGNRFEVMLISEPSISSYDPETGKQLWSIDGMYGEVGPSLAYANGIVFGINEYAMIMAVRVGDSPELIWEDSEYLSDIPSPVATDKFLFVVTSYGAVACYDAKQGNIYWNHDFDEGFNASPIIADGRLYLLDKSGNMHIIKADNKFELISTSPLGEKTSSTPAFSNGKIFIRGDKNLYCIGK